MNGKFKCRAILYVTTICVNKHDENKHGGDCQQEGDEDGVKESKTLLGKLVDAGLQSQLPSDHPILKLYSEVLNVSHPYQQDAVKNYLATVSRVLKYVETRLTSKNNVPPAHWSQLLTEPDIIIEYLEKRSECGMSAATQVAYLKQIWQLYLRATSIFKYKDPSFPRDHMGDGPDSGLAERMIYSMNVLSTFYKGAGKKNNRETFQKKIMETRTQTNMTVIRDLIDSLKTDVKDQIEKLEIFSRTTMKLDVSGKVVDGKRSNVETSRLWRLVTTSLCAILMFDGKPRVGVIQHLKIDEYLRSSRNEAQETTVIWVAKHKLGDKRPATLVLDRTLTDFIDRYYMLRRRVANTAVDNFFITNTGREVTKIFDNINSILKEKNIRYPASEGEAEGEIIKISGGWLRKQIETAAADHEPEMKSQVADALQHTEETAKRHYIVDSATKAIQHHEAVKSVENSKLLEEYISANLHMFFADNIHVKPVAYDEFKCQLKTHENIMAMFPGARITRPAYGVIMDRLATAQLGRRAQAIVNVAVQEDYRPPLGQVQVRHIAKQFIANGGFEENSP